jgi:hypothetical protein
MQNCGIPAGRDGGFMIILTPDLTVFFSGYGIVRLKQKWKKIKNNDTDRNTTDPRIP